jgi:molybdenum cofactor synthesis domain-containing protein
VTADLEIICIGNELLIGKILNTNAQWLSKQATLMGITVKRITVVRDETKEIATAIKEALRRKTNFVVTTGGLGPTFDDKTLEGIAQALNRKLAVNRKALIMVKEKYEAFAMKNHIETIELTQPRIKMATLPRNAHPIFNPVGTAPGVRVDTIKTTLIALPGVPKEMEAIFEKTVAPMLRQASGKTTMFHEKSIHANNIMESSLAPLIDSVMHDNPGVYVKSHPRGEENKPRIEIHLSTTAGQAEKPEEKLQKTVAQLVRAIIESGGNVVYDGKTTP